MWNAMQHCQAGELAEAERQCLQILAIDVRHEEALNLLGAVLHQAGRPEAAAKMIRRAIAINAKKAVYHCELGHVLDDLGKHEEAMAAYKQAQALQADYAEVNFGLGNVYRKQGKLEEAVAEYERALQLSPDNVLFHNNLGATFHAQDKFEEAKAEYHRALALKLDDELALNNMGVAYYAEGKLDEALDCYERAIAVKPDYNGAHWNQSLAQLRQGDFAAGWRNYEWRCLRDNAPRCFPLPLWRGEPLKGARILLHSEQGLGDTLQFLRYLPMVQAMGCSVVLEVQEPLQRIAAELPGLAALVHGGDALPPLDWQCPMMSLPLAFNTTLETIPAQVPYITVPEEAREAAAARDWLEEGLRVGLVWAGNPSHIDDRRRSIPLSSLEPLFCVEGVHFYSLQMGPSAVHLATTGAQITDLTPAISDMADTAALIEQLDLVICVDTAVAHLAGAMARPAWILLPFAPDWRWLQEREDSPWYPTLRLFRQPKLRDWASVIEKVRDALVKETDQLSMKSQKESVSSAPSSLSMRRAARSTSSIRPCR
ncbi:MAG: tetratricopeptide repeat-containing glycosyltransferase family protein [Terracidiphilus sp.]|nr:tetratricopeptide repeat-containing glycosyltransferase family protein [Terracidiphilus sp.]